MEEQRNAKRGRVYLVGAGPGDPKLITVRGKELLSRADVIIYDRLVNHRLLQYARDDAELVYCGKMSDRHEIPQEEINHLLVEYASKGKMVVRLKGGDPCIFGRVGEEAEYCFERDIPFEIVPGVTSGTAAAAYAGIPLTHRGINSSVTFVTGHKKNNTTEGIDWHKLAVGMETIVFFMGVTNLRVIRDNLLHYGCSPETPVALIRWGTWGRQQTLTGCLEDIADRVDQAGFRAPALIIVGEVVKLRERLAWFENKPFFGKTVLVLDAKKECTTGEWGQAVADLVEDGGGEAIVFPARKTTFVEIIRLLEERKVNVVVCTAPEAIDHWMAVVNTNMSIRALFDGVKIVCFGRETETALKGCGWKADIVVTGEQLLAGTCGTKETVSMNTAPEWLQRILEDAVYEGAEPF